MTRENPSGRPSLVPIPRSRLARSGINFPEVNPDTAGLSGLHRESTRPRERFTPAMGAHSYFDVLMLSRTKNTVFSLGVNVVKTTNLWLK